MQPEHLAQAAVQPQSPGCAASKAVPPQTPLHSPHIPQWLPVNDSLSSVSMLLHPSKHKSRRISPFILKHSAVWNVTFFSSADSTERVKRIQITFKLVPYSQVLSINGFFVVDPGKYTSADLLRCELCFLRSLEPLGRLVGIESVADLANHLHADFVNQRTL